LIDKIGAGLACFFATLLAMAALRPVAVVVDLVDKPGGRKTHRGDIPVVGGLAMFLGCVFGIGLLPTSPFVSASLLSAAALVVLVGLLDDRFEISPLARLTAHLVAALIVLATASDLSISSLGRPFGPELIQFSDVGASAFTCLAIVGAINAFNMLDGMDGLAGTSALVALSALTCLSGLIGDAPVMGVSIVAAGAVAAFLIFNVPARFNRRFRCFMGDAGSTLLGFLLACLCISVSQGEGGKISPTTTLWVVAIPLYELLWTTFRRVLKGKSPFHPDRAHFHHKVLDAGFGVRVAFFVLITIGTLLAGVGVWIHAFDIPDTISFALWLACGVGMVVLMQNAKILWHIVPNSFRRERSIDAPTEAG
jgi:UDP-GlcNAc:undecaprenyl-phosphate/decaprenyl-phosphate GlcNAc-1-phosphate transferase